MDKQKELEFRETFANNLKYFMCSRGYSQGDLADDSGLSVSTINRYLNRVITPSLQAVINLSRTLDCRIDDLIGSNHMIID